MSEQTEITAIELNNPDALRLPEIQDLFHRACAEDNSPNELKVLAWSLKAIQNGNVGIFITRNGDGIWNGLAIIEDARNVWVPDPWVLFMYSGAPGVRHALVSAGIDWLRKRDLDAVTMLNMTGASDTAHLRQFKRYAKGSVIGSQIRYSLNEAGEE